MPGDEVPALLIVGRGGVEGAYGAAELYLGMALAQGSGYHLIALFKHGADDVFVAYAQILQVERLGVTRLGTATRPDVRRRVGVSPLNEVAEVVDVGSHLVHRYATLLSGYALGIGSRVLTGHTGRQHGQRLGADVLAEQEILVEAQSARLVVVPDVFVGFALPERTDGLVPAVDIVESLAVAHATAGETHELGMQGGDGLSQVFAQSVLAPFKRRLREEAHHVNGSLALVKGNDDKLCTAVGTRRREHSLIAAPALALALQRGLRNGGAVAGAQLYAEALLATHKHGEVIVPALLQGYAVPPLVPQRVSTDNGMMWILGREGIGVGDDDVARRVPGGGGAPLAAVAAGVFEVAVLYELGIETAVGRVADVFEEDAYELVADGLLAGEVDGERGSNRLLQPGQRLCIVVHALGREARLGSLTVEMVANFAHFIGRKHKLVTLHALSADGGHVAAPQRQVVDGHGEVGGEGTEVAGGMGHADALLGVEVDVEAVLSRAHHRVLTLADAHARIVLRPPRHQVGTIGGSKHRRMVVHLEDQTPRAVVSTTERGVVHALLRAPRPVVAGAELPQMAPARRFLHGNVQAVVLAR